MELRCISRSKNTAYERPKLTPLISMQVSKRECNTIRDNAGYACFRRSSALPLRRSEGRRYFKYLTVFQRPENA